MDNKKTVSNSDSEKEKIGFWNNVNDVYEYTLPINLKLDLFDFKKKGKRTILKVFFGDNDFCTVFKQSCDFFLQELNNGYETSKHAQESLNSLINQHSMEHIRESLVLSALGFYIAKKGYQCEKINNNELKTVFSETHNYLNNLIKIEIIDDFKEEWENSEVCYIDFNNLTVTLQ